MAKFKKGQTVYFYRTSGDYLGEIIHGTISGATKDLLTGETSYVVSIPANLFYLCYLNEETVKAENLYTSKKQIYKEHRDEIAYLNLYKKIDKLDKAVNKVFAEYAEKIEAAPGFATLSISSIDQTSHIVIDGIGDLRTEFDKLKDEVANIKKKIKKSTKKPVVKKTEEKKNEVKL